MDPVVGSTAVAENESYWLVAFFQCKITMPDGNKKLPRKLFVHPELHGAFSTLE